MNDSYAAFLAAKAQLSGNHGFAPRGLPGFLFPFQAALVEWATRRGRAAIFADCGLGKTPMQLVWADQVARRTGKSVLILTPLAVAQQTVAEAQRFGIEAVRSERGEIPAPITVTNYERLHHFRPDDFAGVGSEVYGAVRNGRVGIGIELKPSYYRQALKNLAAAVEERAEQAPLDLFSLAGLEVPA